MNENLRSNCGSSSREINLPPDILTNENSKASQTTGWELRKLTEPLITLSTITEISGMSPELFFLLYDFLENKMNKAFDISIMKQLLCVIGKLRQNKYYFVNEFEFPLVFISNVEIMYDIFHSATSKQRGSQQSFCASSNVMDIFKFPKKFIVVDILSVRIEIKSSQNSSPTQIGEAKVLLAFTLDGRICYNSKVFVNMSTKDIVQQTEVLDNLKNYYFVLYHYGLNTAKKGLENGVYIIDCETFFDGTFQHIHKCNLEREKFVTDMIQTFRRTFPVLDDNFPSFMLNDEKEPCFLNKVIEVCCHLYNIFYIS